MRVALTGAASGIGAAVAEKLIAAGDEVTAFDIAKPEAAVACWIATDMNDPASIATALASAEGPFDALINNAGLPPRDGCAVMTLNVNFMGFRAFYEGMLGKLAPGASIVNTASRAGAAWRENIEQVKALMALDHPDQLEALLAQHKIDDVRAYNLSKEAVIAFTMQQAERLIAKDFRINSVSPAAVSTGILDDFVSAFGPKVAQTIARTGRAGTPDEIADVILFLARPHSHWIKGQDIVIDGGITAMMTSDALGLTS